MLDTITKVDRFVFSPFGKEPDASASCRIYQTMERAPVLSTPLSRAGRQPPTADMVGWYRCGCVMEATSGMAPTPKAIDGACIADDHLPWN